MRKRKKMSMRGSKKLFKKGQRTKKKNFITKPQRGGMRL